MTVPNDALEDKQAMIDEENRIERLMTAREIFACGFKFGLALAGLREDADKAFDDWLLERAI